jgi:pseudaminic acid biosynthesis-associated methylase
MRSKTPQELFWEGEFGTEYTARNTPDARARVPFFKTLLERTFGVRSFLEMGCNRGHNLAAVQMLSPNFECVGIDVNEAALKELNKIPGLTGHLTSIQDFNPGRKFDVVYTGGVLTHLCPEDLPTVYKKMYELSNRYICINEYFNPEPVEVTYRGHSERLYKRDFAAEFIDANGGNSKIRVVDYGFLWSRVNPNYGDSNWFLLEKID